MAARGQNHGKGKNKQAYAPKPKILPSPKREDHAKDSICHECGETGHWKRNCPQYLAELLKKKKNAASGAGGSEKLQHDGLLDTSDLSLFKIMSRQGASYFVTFTDDFSRYGYVYLLKHKHEVFETFKVFQKDVENQLGKTIKSLRSDRGGEYMSQEFLDHLKDHGIIAHRTPPYTPQHNGVSERRNITLLVMVRSIMSQTTLPKSFWDYALETAARILNMVPTKKVEKKPYEVWHGKSPKLSHLKVWGLSGEIDEPQSDIVPIRRSTRTRHAPDRMCLYIDVEEHELGDLGEPANELPPNGKTVGSKWLFKKKTDMDGVVHTYKARLVAKGYTQTPRIDYKETFSPVADIRAIRILITIAVYYDYEIWKIDVKTAFLNGYLNEEVYIEQPKGFVNPKYPNWSKHYELQGFQEQHADPQVLSKQEKLAALGAFERLDSQNPSTNHDRHPINKEHGYLRFQDKNSVIHEDNVTMKNLYREDHQEHEVNSPQTNTVTSAHHQENIASNSNDFKSTCSLLVRAIKTQLASHHKTRQYILHKHYLKYPTKEEEMTHLPNGVKVSEWVLLCDRFASKKIQKISVTNKQNRACNEVPPTVSTKSVARRIHMETRKRSNDDWRVQDSPLAKKNKAMINDKATKIWEDYDIEDYVEAQVDGM
nr:retrotransposon protein, putative, Ty1-copia subclass [Tanacetum cinerariifolium]